MVVGVLSESEVALSCPALCDHMDCSLPGSSIHGIFQARVLEWIAFPSPGDLPNPGIEPRSPALQADALLSEPPGKPNENPCLLNQLKTQIIISVPQNVVRMWMGS